MTSITNTLTQDSMQSINICQITTEPYHSKIQDLANSIGSLKVIKDAGFFLPQLMSENYTCSKNQKQLKKVSGVQNRCKFQNANKY